MAIREVRTPFYRIRGGDRAFTDVLHLPGDHHLARWHWTPSWTDRPMPAGSRVVQLGRGAVPFLGGQHGDELRRVARSRRHSRHRMAHVRLGSSSYGRRSAAQGKIDAARETVNEAVEKAPQIVVSPETATWVKPNGATATGTGKTSSTGCC